MYCGLYDFATWAAGLQSAASVICPVMWPSWAPAARSYPTMSLQVSFESLTTLKMFVTLDIFQEIYLSSADLRWLWRKWKWQFNIQVTSFVPRWLANKYFGFVTSITIPLQSQFIMSVTFPGSDNPSPNDFCLCEFLRIIFGGPLIEVLTDVPSVVPLDLCLGVHLAVLTSSDPTGVIPTHPRSIWHV